MNLKSNKQTIQYCTDFEQNKWGWLQETTLMTAAATAAAGNNQGLLSQVGQSHDPGERAIT